MKSPSARWRPVSGRAIPALYADSRTESRLELGLATRCRSAQRISGRSTRSASRSASSSATARTSSRTAAFDDGARACRRARRQLLAHGRPQPQRAVGRLRAAWRSSGASPTEVLAEVRSAGGSAADWVERYSAAGRLDARSTRSSDAWSRSSPSLTTIRRSARSPWSGAPTTSCARSMADGFTKALVKAEWSVPGVLHQTQVLRRRSSPSSRKPVAYFLVDAMRFEMGARAGGPAARRRQRSASGRPSSRCRRSRPSAWRPCTPGPTASFDVVAESGKFGSRIEGTFLPDLTARRKFAGLAHPGARGHDAGRGPRLVEDQAGGPGRGRARS